MPVFRSSGILQSWQRYVRPRRESFPARRVSRYLQYLQIMFQSPAPLCDRPAVSIGHSVTRGCRQYWRELLRLRCSSWEGKEGKEVYMCCGGYDVMNSLKSFSGRMSKCIFLATSRYFL